MKKRKKKNKQIYLLNFIKFIWRIEVVATSSMKKKTILKIPGCCKIETKWSNLQYHVFVYNITSKRSEL
jgi:hypothetical protein